MAGFRVNPNRELCKSIDEVIEFCNRMEAKREDLDYEIDGVVVKVNSTAMQERVWRDRQSAALGSCVQVCGSPGDDAG